MKNFDSLRNIFGGRVISKLLSEVMTASGWRHDKQCRSKDSERWSIVHASFNCTGTYRSIFSVCRRILAVRWDDFGSHGMPMDRIQASDNRYGYSDKRKSPRRQSAFSQRRCGRQKRRKRSLDFPVYNRILSLKEVA